MAAHICNTNILVQRLSVFVTDFIRKTYGFLTPEHVTELRNLRMSSYHHASEKRQKVEYRH